MAPVPALARGLEASRSIDPAAMFSAIVDRIHVGIFSVDASMVVIQWNRFMELNTGLAAADVLGRRLFDCVPALPERWLEQKIRGVLILKNFAFTSWRQRPYLLPFSHNRPVTGGVDHMQQDVTFMPLKDADGEVVAVCVMIFDATDASLAQREAEDAGRKLKEAAAALELLAIQDGLTGTSNRRHLERQLTLEFERFQRYEAPLSVLLFDLDHFKRINDGYGHAAGDEVLRTVAARVGGVIRSTDTFGRYGGEEFALLLPGVGIADAMIMAERVRAAIASAPVMFGDGSIPVTVSIGVSEARSTMVEPTALLKEADSALYRCKAAGRNCVLPFVP